MSTNPTVIRTRTMRALPPRPIMDRLAARKAPPAAAVLYVRYRTRPAYHKFEIRPEWVVVAMIDFAIGLVVAVAILALVLSLRGALA